MPFKSSWDLLPPTLTLSRFSQQCKASVEAERWRHSLTVLARNRRCTERPQISWACVQPQVSPRRWSNAPRTTLLTTLGMRNPQRSTHLHRSPTRLLVAVKSCEYTKIQLKSGWTKCESRRPPRRQTDHSSRQALMIKRPSEAQWVAISR